MTAERLFDEGRRLLENGKLDDACAKLEGSLLLEPAVGTLLNLGACNERRGRLASAWSNYRAAASLALSKNDSARADFAQKKRDAVQPRLAWMTVAVSLPDSSLIVKLDGVLLERAAWSVALPVDPGVHTVEAEAPGKKPWSNAVTIPDGRSSTTVNVESLASVPPAQAAEPPRPPLAPNIQTRSHAPLVRTLGWVGVAVGSAALVTGGYFGLRAQSGWSDAEPHCDASRACDDTGYSLTNDARANGNVATFAVTTGLVLLAAGVLTVLLVPSRPTRTMSFHAAGFQL